MVKFSFYSYFIKGFLNLFLVTTADQRFWKKDEEILFLGEWCRRYQEKEQWAGLDAEVFPYHWDDREKFYNDYVYLNRLYERYLVEATKKLNEAHGVDHSVRYWRIIIGPWLCYFIQAFYDRYFSISAVINSKKNVRTWLPRLEPELYIPQDFYSFRQYIVEDGYNHYLYGRIIEALGGIPYETKDIEVQLTATRRNFSSMGTGKLVAKKFLSSLGRMVPSALNKVVFISSYLHPRDITRLQLSLGQIPCPVMPLVTTGDATIDLDLRSRLKLSSAENQFEQILEGILFEQMPAVYLEGFAGLNSKALSDFPRQPKVIFTANGLIAQEGFKFWAAAQVEQGAKLVATTHGGVYGTAGWSSNEAHEIAVSDKYFSWGWDDKTNEKIIPLPSGQLQGLKPKIKPDPKGGILWIAITFTRYSCQLVSIPLARQTLDYLKDQETFARSVLPEVHRLLTKRIFPVDFGWNEELRWADMDSTLKIYLGEKDMYQQLNESRLCIGTYNSTTDLETLSKNFPTIIFFTPKHWELRDSAKPFFDELLRVGIYHESPQSAAAKVNEVYRDPMAWWYSPDVQEARKNFCRRFARTEDNWIYEWKKRFKELMNE